MRPENTSKYVSYVVYTWNIPWSRNRSACLEFVVRGGCAAPPSCTRQAEQEHSTTFEKSPKSATDTVVATVSRTFDHAYRGSGLIVICPAAHTSLVRMLGKIGISLVVRVENCLQLTGMLVLKALRCLVHAGPSSIHILHVPSAHSPIPPLFCRLFFAVSSTPP